MTETTTPETFDFADWFADANLPESSADIYLNAAVLSDLAEVERRMALEAAAVKIEKNEQAAVEPSTEETPDAEKTLSQKRAPEVTKPTPAQARLSALETEWAGIAQRFEDSKVTVYCRALTGAERQEIRGAHDLAQKNDGEDNRFFVLRCLAASIVGTKKATGKRTPATLSLEQVEQLYKKIGDAQIGRINDAYLTATNAIPTVDADFLRKLSGPAAGPES